LDATATSLADVPSAIGNTIAGAEQGASTLARGELAHEAQAPAWTVGGLGARVALGATDVLGPAAENRALANWMSDPTLSPEKRRQAQSEYTTQLILNATGEGLGNVGREGDPLVPAPWILE
jgi:hypothetical protein